VAKKKQEKLTYGKLRKMAVPAVLIPGLIAGIILGNNWWKNKTNYYEIKTVFPETGMVREIIDGDTFELQSTTRIRLVGVDAPASDAKSTNFLSKLVLDKKVWLEYDRYQEDKYGRTMAWVWTGCESKPKFLPADYMFLNKRQSRPGLTENPIGCKKGKLVQEEMVKAGVAEVETYKDRGKLKYVERVRRNSY
jgi:endonuclease YncB( thermonuclease family)